MRIFCFISVVSVVAASSRGKRSGDFDLSMDDGNSMEESGTIKRNRGVNRAGTRTPFKIMLEELLANPQVSDQAIMHRINTELPGVAVSHDFLPYQRAFLNRISGMPQWMHEVMKYNLDHDDIEHCRELAAHMMTYPHIKQERFNSVEELAQVIRVWGQYCIGPLRMGITGNCHAGKVLRGDGSVVDGWVLSPAGMNQFLRNTLNEQ